MQEYQIWWARDFTIKILKNSTQPFAVNLAAVSDLRLPGEVFIVYYQAFTAKKFQIFKVKLLFFKETLLCQFPKRLWSFLMF